LREDKSSRACPNIESACLIAGRTRSSAPSGISRFLSRFARRAGLVHLRQTFVLRCHGGNCSGRASKRSNEGVFGEQIWLGVPMRGL
jgi:hypothetical protein